MSGDFGRSIASQHQRIEIDANDEKISFFAGILAVFSNVNNWGPVQWKTKQKRQIRRTDLL